MTYRGVGFVAPLVKNFLMTKCQTGDGRLVYILRYDIFIFGRRLGNWCNIVGSCGELGLFDVSMKFGK